MENINTPPTILEFTLENIGTASGVIIALASKDLIYSCVSDILLPLLNNYLFFSNNSKPNFKNVFTTFITFILVLFNTYLFYILLLKLDKKESKKEKKEYNKNKY
jgi:large-conductance mechanosensitive channel